MLCAPALRAETTVLRLATTGAPNSATGRGAAALTEAVGRLGTPLRVESYFYGSAGGEAELTEALTLGSIDLAILNVSALSGIAPMMSLFDAMFLFRDARHGRAVMDGPLGREAIGWLEPKGVVGLAWGENGMRHMTSTQPIRSPADLRDLTIRIPASDVLSGGFTVLGGKPVVLPFPELYTALASGQVAAQENPITVAEGSRFFEVQKTLSLTGHAYSSCLFALSGRTAARLSPATRTALTEGARQAAQVTRDVSEAAERDGIERLRKAGMTVAADVDRGAFTAALTGFTASLAPRFGQGRLDTIRNAAA
ncbi:TRAP transporter substrate-binding protein [Roseomonas elaeocarpi]|uniref:TRAP transporter substrate-binding protein n=1 Tax=Roseomonas elaeocarpi TaxID=907779 RepID=A0ABV6JUI7_9PROT